MGFEAHILKASYPRPHHRGGVQIAALVVDEYPQRGRYIPCPFHPLAVAGHHQVDIAAGRH